MEVNSFDDAVRGCVGPPEHLGGEEWIVLTSQDKSEPIEWRPPHKCTAYIDVVIIVATRERGIAGFTIAVIRGTELNTAEEVPFQFKIRVQSQPEPPTIPLNLVVVICRVGRRRQLR